MKKRLTAFLIMCALVLSACSGGKDTPAPTPGTESHAITENSSKDMLTYKDKTVSEDYYGYLLSVTKYDFLDTYLEYSRIYAERGMDFGKAYFGTEVADTEDFWNAVMEEDGRKITVAGMVKKQTLNFAKCVIVFDSAAKDAGYAFSSSETENAEKALKTRCGKDPAAILSKIGVTYDEALSAQLVSSCLDGLKEHVTKAGGKAEVTGEATEKELAQSVRYKAISYYGTDKTETDKKAKVSYDRIVSSETDFETELKNSDDYGELTGEYKDGTLLSKDEFRSTFGLGDDYTEFAPGTLFTAENEAGSYVILITDFTESDRANAFSSAQSKAFSEFLRQYTSDIVINEKATEEYDFFKAARVSG